MKRLSLLPPAQVSRAASPARLVPSHACPELSRGEGSGWPALPAPAAGHEPCALPAMARQQSSLRRWAAAAVCVGKGVVLLYLLSSFILCVSTSFLVPSAFNSAASASALAGVAGSSPVTGTVGELLTWILGESNP